MNKQNYTFHTNGKIWSKVAKRFLKPWVGISGYEIVRFERGDRSHFVHRLIAEEFIPNPDNLPQVNHKDGNKTNNDINNLEWKHI